MALLLNQRGEPLQDANGKQLKAGATIVDDLFGDGIVRGTIPIEIGEGFNVLIDWLGPGASEKPKSRDPKQLKLKYNGGTRILQQHSGADFESGRVYRQRGENDAEAWELRGDAEMEEPAGAAAGCGSPSPRAGVVDVDEASPNRAARTSPRVEAAARAATQQHPPWLGKAAKFDAIGKEIISHYTHTIVHERKLDGGSVIVVPKIRYRTKYEPEAKTRVMGDNFPITRLGDFLLSSDHVHTP